MPKPPPMFRIRTGAGAERASSIASATAFCCASTMASARRFCEPLKMWKPTKSSGSVARVAAALPARARRRCRTASGRRAIFMPEVLSSKSGLTRIATCGRRPVSRAMSREPLDLELAIRRSERCPLQPRRRARRRLAGAGEADALGGHARIERDLHLARPRRRRVRRPASAMCRTTAGIGIRLDRVVQVDLARQRCCAAARRAPSCAGGQYA